MHWKTSSENLLQDIRAKEGLFIGKLFRQEKEGRFPHGSRPSFSDLLFQFSLLSVLVEYRLSSIDGDNLAVDIGCII